MKAMLKNDRMKSRLQELLHCWGGDSRVLFGTFFFFRPGLNLQKSQLGFLQSILHQILSQRPHLIDCIYSPLEKARAIDRLKHLKVDEVSVWSLNELRRALEKWRASDDACLYLHVDGIDEIDCEALELAHLLLDLVALPNVKILAAGRYHPDFNACFDVRQKLNIHELTELDILRFVVDSITNSGLEDVLDKIEISPQLAKFIHEITSAAQGVFQWVKIAVDSLIRGTHRFETFEELFTRLKEYPPDLDDLYFFLYHQIEPRYVASVAFWMLALFCENQASNNGRFKMDTYYMSQAEIYDLNDEHWLSCRLGTTPGSMCAHAKRLQGRIQSRSPHFFDFEVTSNPVKRVFLAHRTVLDFLRKDSFAMVKELYARLEPRHLPKLSVTAVGTLCRLSTRLVLVKPETPHDWQHDILPLSHTLLKRGLMSQMISFWAQIQKALADFTWGDSSYYTRRPVPTSTGWVEENLFDTARRVGVRSYQFLHVLALSTFTPLISGHIEMILDIATSISCDCVERELLLLELFWAQSLYPGHELEQGETAQTVLRVLFPNGVSYDCFCLRRILETVRRDIHWFPRTKKRPLLKIYWHHLESSLWLIHDLIQYGANPSTTCRPVRIDPDKSLVSVKHLLTHVERITSFETRSVMKYVRPALRKLNVLIREKGGTDFSIAADQHQETEANVPEGYFNTNSSKFE